MKKEKALAFRCRNPKSVWMLLILMAVFILPVLLTKPDSCQAKAAWKHRVKSTTDRVVVVTSYGTSAKVSLFRKTRQGHWKRMMLTYGYVGTGGVGTASEYCSKTPKGIYSFTFAFGTDKNPGARISYRELKSSDYWVDDVHSRYYNQFVDASQVTKDWNSAEALYSCKTAYAYALAFDYNAGCIPGKGSAFFLHCTIGGPTQGCIGIPKDKMRYLLKHLSYHAQIVIR